MKTYFYTGFALASLLTTAALAQDSAFANIIGMELVLIKPGSFVMGRFQPPHPVPSDSGATHAIDAGNGYTAAHYAQAIKEAQQDAQPGFEVTIAKPFYIGRFEVTQAQWKKVMGTNPSAFQISGDHPVETVGWNDAQRFVQKLNALERGRRYRLPTEAEWEYAARAGATGDIPWRDIQAQAQLGGRTTSPVGGKAPNAWGLHDMLGNVWEWVADLYNEKLFADEVPPKKGRQHVLKGASFAGDVKNATYMTHAAGPANSWDVGFRVVLEVLE